MERTRAEAGEISVFGAERYFSMKLDVESPRHNGSHGNQHGLKGENPVDLPQNKQVIMPGTPSMSSESSYYSHSALLQNFSRNRIERKLKRVDSRSFFSALGCTGSCLNGKSVSINQNVEKMILEEKECRNPGVQRQQKSPASDRWKQPQFDSRSFETMSSSSSRTVKIQPGKSPRVLGASPLTKGDIAFNLERKLSMLTWDAIPNAPNLPSSFGGSSSQPCDDIGSDASSDLFEIENVSSNGHRLFSRDGMSSCVTPYEPSETSIEWSVVTASAADFSDVKSSVSGWRTPGRVATARSTREWDRETPRSKPGGLLGCRSQKAVRVAETAYRFDHKMMSPRHYKPPKSVTLNR